MWHGLRALLVFLVVLPAGVARAADEPVPDEALLEFLAAWPEDAGDEGFFDFIASLPDGQPGTPDAPPVEADADAPR